jgi:hypothetical protein
VKVIDNSEFSIEQRYTCFDSFTEDIGEGITLRILELVENFEQFFNLCIGHEYVKAEKPFCWDVILTSFL